MVVRLVHSDPRSEPSPDQDERFVHTTIELREEETDQRASLEHPPGGVRMALLRTETVDWLSPGRLAAAKLHIVEGDPGYGKSTLLADWAARISRGRPLPDGDPRAPAGVVFLSAEDGLTDTLKPRLEAAGADLARVIALTEKPNGEPYVLPRDIGFIEERVRAEGAALVIIDTLAPYVDPTLNINADQDIRRVLTPLAAMAERTSAAVAIVRHLNKQVGSSALYRGSGSIGIAGAARIVLLVGVHPDDANLRILARSKGNIGAQPLSLAFALEPVDDLGVTHVVYQGTAQFTADELVTPRDGVTPPSAFDRATEWVRTALTAGPIPSAQLADSAKAVGISEATLRRAMSGIGVRSTKDQTANGQWLRSLPAVDPSIEASAVAADRSEREPGSLAR
jgi:hypothetical protein